MDPQQRSGKPILIVEDDPDQRDLLLWLLREEGYSVLIAPGGQEALDLLQAGVRPGLILLDLSMPGMSGWEFRVRQQADPALTSIAVVAITGRAHAIDAILAMGFADYITKPVELHRLLAVVAQHWA